MTDIIPRDKIPIPQTGTAWDAAFISSSPQFCASTSIPQKLFSKAMKLAKLLDPKNNNLDLFRLIAAALVIYGHAYALNPVAGATDFVRSILIFDYSGSLAVKMFFFISGLVVANSLISKDNLTEYAISRISRILPGLIFVLFISSFAIGPIISEYSLQDYFKEKYLYSYFLKNIVFHTSYVLPGVFKTNPYPDAVNGSLWTLPYEVASYILLFAIYAIGIFKSRILVLFVLTLILIDPFTGNKILFTWRTPHNEVDFLAPCFALGVAAAYFKNHLEVNFKGVIGLFLVYWIFKQSTFNQLLFLHCYFLCNYLYQRSTIIN